MKNKFTFENAPTIHGRRSAFDLSHSQTTTGTVGRLQPFLVQEVYPGDTFTIEDTSVIKVTSNFIKPPTGNIFFERYYFYVPNRLVLNDWENVVANNSDPDGWEETTQSSVPTTSVANITEKSIADFMRIPIFARGNNKLSVSVLPFREFALIYNDWFRNENFQERVYVPKSNTNSSLNGNEWSVSNIMGMCPKVNKYKDLFTTSLPAPQKGDATMLPFVIPPTLIDTVNQNITDTTRVAKFPSGKPLAFRWGTNTPLEYIPDQTELIVPYSAGFADDVTADYNVRGMVAKSDGANDNDFVNGEGIVANANFDLTNLHITGTNLVIPQVDMSLSIDDLYKAMALQRAHYLYGLGGSRYIEILRSIWNIDSPDARLQRPELIYGEITPINFQQVTQTTGSDETDNKLGNLSAYSNTLSKCKFYKGFLEHGFIIGVCCFRQKHLYQQGVERFWLRKDSTDFYNPLFANFGEVNVNRAEIYAQETHDDDGNLIPFGYQEAWYDLRYRQSAITGEANSYAENTLDIWHFGDKYSNAPVLGSEFISEVPDFVDRGLAVDSDVQDQFIIDTRFTISAIRRLPVRSIPGVQSVY